MTIALSLLTYANDEVDKALEIRIFEEVVNVELDSEYQSTPLSRFEETIVSQS